MSSLQDLLAQRAEIEKKIIDVQREERANAIAKVRALLAEFGLTAADISGKAPAVRASGAAKPAGKVAAKYRNAATGDTWTGRGLQPRWLKAALAAGAKLEDFSV
jgi:DNA-binding protein H-NS